MSKNVLFVIDKSGSMAGKKIQQTREALVKILKDLSPQDQFNLIVFSGESNQWEQSLVQATEENLNRAVKYASRIQAQGGEYLCILGGWGLPWSPAGTNPESVPFRDQHQ